MSRSEELSIYPAMELRRKFILKEFARLKKTCLYTSVIQICRVIASLPCQFFISHRTAEILYDIYIVGKRHAGLSPYTRSRQSRIFVERMKQLHDECPSLTKKEIIERILNSDAPNLGVGASFLRKYILHYEKCKKAQRPA